MKQFAAAVLLVAGLILAGCGSNTNPGNINGNWNATLMSNGNNTAFTFGTSLQVNADGSVSVVNFNFTKNDSSCFVSGETESGSFTLSGNFNGQVSGSFGMTVKSGNPSGNTLQLNGTVSNGNTISGTWTLTGNTGCTGSGSFTMSKM